MEKLLIKVKNCFFKTHRLEGRLNFRVEGTVTELMGAEGWSIISAAHASVEFICRNVIQLLDLSKIPLMVSF